MDRLLSTAFDEKDVPHGRFWRPPYKTNEITFWPILAEDIVRGVAQCTEARERLASSKHHNPNDDDGGRMSKQYMEMWARMAILSAYRLYTAIEDILPIEEIIDTADSDLTGGGVWQMTYHEWDVRDAAKISSAGPSIMALFSTHMETWTAGLRSADRLGECGEYKHNMQISAPVVKNALLGALEVARYVVVLALPICNYQVPPGMEDDRAGRAIRNCCGRLQRRMISGYTRDPGEYLDAEETYYRAMVRIVTFERAETPPPDRCEERDGVTYNPYTNSALTKKQTPPPDRSDLARPQNFLSYVPNTRSLFKHRPTDTSQNCQLQQQTPQVQLDRTDALHRTTMQSPLPYPTNQWIHQPRTPLIESRHRRLEPILQRMTHRDRPRPRRFVRLGPPTILTPAPSPFPSSPSSFLLLRGRPSGTPASALLLSRTGGAPS
ncbi:protein SORF3 [Falconid herpesvirus 1]|uniref:Protein SORF3 n=2 Tax=Columbid alphaherpesvirus 1 TaxID=93386 RepID=A0A068EW51_9ALPH|nr:protein SORF3 [Falconid herpesvirus 1]YP_009352998.1 protein SORF3 [Columbid alphaherpesvirus 1]AID52794.1 protein SORF3 [Falconid herpesvirus 1]ARD71415.1 protein SORF3 [Columbid alphaherpesvirus 1]